MPNENPPKDVDMKALRREYPSGWMQVAWPQSLPFIIDALIDSSPRSEFNKTELAQKAGVSRESIRKHLDRLLKLGLVEEVEKTSPQRYRLNDDGPVTKELFELNSAINAVQTGHSDPNGENPILSEKAVNQMHAQGGLYQSTKMFRNELKVGLSET